MIFSCSNARKMSSKGHDLLGRLRIYSNALAFNIRVKVLTDIDLNLFEAHFFGDVSLEFPQAIIFVEPKHSRGGTQW